ncbi:rhomboid family intramembrane serine protease [Marivirga sp.]|uniref:rhomboid family intramembrane serine protease n=1 Tax=Marivirga sp. TaxID=2018662 RepID=UPI002D8111D9|nr:rhomboid family intramembrane serine protease [Marivirga sp.]HET8860800.1 rhomboid family intramembrane serine protease [Marivirga sp.]
MSTTVIIIIVTCIISIPTFSNPSRMYAWMFNPYQVVYRKQYYRMLTSGFLHADYMHLIFNMITLYFFGDAVEYYFNQLTDYGTLLYVGLYLTAIVISDIPSLIKHKENPNYNALGASGAVSAVVFSSILFNPMTDLCLYGLLCLPGFIFGAIYVIYSYYKGKQQGDNVNHDAHLFGAIYGVIITIAIWPGVVMHFIDHLSTFSLF